MPEVGGGLQCIRNASESIVEMESSGKRSQTDTNSTTIDKLKYTDLFPIDENGYKPTKEFLLQVIEICLDFIQKSNDRTTKVLDFHTPEEMKKLFDFSIPDEPLDIKQIVTDCRDALKYQVKTAPIESHNVSVVTAEDYLLSRAVVPNTNAGLLSPFVPLIA
ncbi:unnamed protein product [Medioppia subpectinata]|uniref:Uncharacterized protein n=1 Tax=Medioppia subpectinata TaxID=1979941 RepID=A0A7R9KCX1_9ACAR|nr:unnamed protein product [Medioppia subpectinata]CAG2101184.1 unnamed protein product [Medioppia subpectinata]